MSTHSFSLVTACMNREAHLRENLGRWLALPFIGEVVVVDWSNDRPLIDLAQIDDRIRVVRVVGEPHWVLPYAYNLGIAQASNEMIIKSDADSAPKASIEGFKPTANCFFAGNWQSGQSDGKSAVNGQCIVSRTQFERVNGYSELMRVYGYDDQDFYARLSAAGYERREIDAATFDVAHHSDVDRLANQQGTGPSTSVEAFLKGNIAFFEMQNYFIARVMPWGPWFLRARYETLEEHPRAVIMRRRRDLEIVLPGPVAVEARIFATRFLLKNILNLPGPVCERLEESACRDLLGQWLSARPRPT
jgi:hypothetical protein